MPELDFPAWLRVTHLINIIFLSLLARSGMEILSAHPKLYWNNIGRPGSEWLRLTKKRVPEGALWTSHDEEERFSPLIALPGRGHLGLGRHWHFASVAAWILTGLTYVALLFGTGEWRRLIPTSWSVFADAWNTLVAYLTFRIPESPAYNGLQQLSYAGVVFVLSPLLLLTGAAMSPAIAAQFPRYPALFGGHQRARSLHFLGLVAVSAFTVVHTVMVVIHGLPESLTLILLGQGDDRRALAVSLGVVFLAALVAVHVLATDASLRGPRATQRALGAVVDPVQRALSRGAVSRQQGPESEIGEFFRVNGRPPEDDAYATLLRDGFAGWKLEVRGLVDRPRCFTLDELLAMPKQTTVTTHHCIQGWSNVGQWGGVDVSAVLDTCGVKPSARYAVFHAMDDKGRTEPETGDGRYYEVVDLALLRKPQAILAYEMNGKPLTAAHGAPLRLRLETQLGFKMVKYLHAIELVEDYRDVGAGMGGWREDTQQYSHEAAI